MNTLPRLGLVLSGEIKMRERGNRRGSKKGDGERKGEQTGRNKGRGKRENEHWEGDREEWARE